MKVFVCTQCSKLKKKKRGEQTAITGEELYEKLSAWVREHHLEMDLKIKSVRCLDECKKGPVVLTKSPKMLHKRLTEEKFEELTSYLQGQLQGLSFEDEE